MAVADRAAFVLLTEELSDDSILEEARSCEDEEFLLFLLIREMQSHVRIENYFERIKPQCFRLLISFSDVNTYSQLFGTPVGHLSRSASWTKEWGKTFHLLTEADIDYDMDTEVDIDYDMDTWEP